MSWMLQESNLSAVCEKVLDKCLAPSTAGGEGCDNMTMILVQLKKPLEQNGPACTVEGPSLTESTSEADDSKSQEPEQPGESS